MIRQIIFTPDQFWVHNDKPIFRSTIITNYITKQIIVHGNIYTNTHEPDICNANTFFKLTSRKTSKYNTNLDAIN